MLLRVPTIVCGTQYITYAGQNAGTSSYKDTGFGVKQYDFSLLEKCWDELHQREKVVQYYLKFKGRRRHYLNPEEVIAYKAHYAQRGQHPPGLFAKVGYTNTWVSGGPFAKIMYDRHERFVVRGKGTYINLEIKPYEAKYVGGFLPLSFGPACPSAPDLYSGYQAKIQVPQNLHEGLEALGAKGWNKARPRTSVADLPTFIGELKDLPGMLRQSAKGFHDLWSSIVGRNKSPLSLDKVPRKASEHFLNHAFGWAPFVSDLIKFHEVHQNLDAHITQLVRDNGQWVKRRRRIEETTEIQSMSVHPGTTAAVIPGALHDWMYKPQNGLKGKTNYWVEETSTVWFVGRFKYYVPRPPDSPDTRDYNRVMDMLRLYGVKLSPSVIWNLTPWSWLTDWFGNAGDVVDNITAQNTDNLAAKYAYIMRHKHTSYVNDSTIYLHGAGSDGVRCTWSTRLDTKARVEASPFGFGLTGGGIDSPYRAAILGALGLTRRG